MDTAWACPSPGALRRAIAARLTAASSTSLGGTVFTLLLPMESPKAHGSRVPEAVSDDPRMLPK